MGIPMYIGPNKVTGNMTKWLKKALNNPNYAKQRISSHSIISKGGTKNITIIQEYILRGYIWRVIKIGKTYFAHQKVKYKDKCNGKKGTYYVNSPLELLDYVREFFARNNLYSVAIDIFEYNNLYLVNEIQTIFGHVQDHILEVDGKPERYLYNNQWTFEEGYFNNNESYNLLLECALDLYSRGLL
jgi:glutathione synthase/RimK-type ligase-like ATP-grasp enzyme